MVTSVDSAIVACPWCAKDFPVLVLVRDLTICPSCLHTCAVDADAVRVATTADVDALVSAELASLRATKKAARAKLQKA